MIRSRPLLAILALSLLLWGAAAQDDVEEGVATSAIDTAAGTSPAKWYPGWWGGGIWWKNKLCCTRTVCSPGWRASCGDTAFCKKKHCRTENAADGSVCDISPCVQGNCYNGVCQGGGNAMCPNPANECREYKCSPKTGQCRESCPRPNGTPCNNGLGSCQCGVCVPIPPKCPPNPDNCNKYEYDEATGKCNLVATECTQPSDPKYECKILRCKKRTGLCTAFWNKPNGEECSVGKCLNGVCVPDATCPTNCPTHKNPCKYYECDERTGKCTIEKNACDGAACPGGKCKNGQCIAAPKCPTTCPKHPNSCKAYVCNAETGKCTDERNKDEGATCSSGGEAGRCDGGGQCIVLPKCTGQCPKDDPAGNPCKQLGCDESTGKCDKLENVRDGTLCPGGKCAVGECIQASCPVAGPCEEYIVVDGVCKKIIKVGPCNDNNACTSNDTCINGVCQGESKICPARQNSSCSESICNPDSGNCEAVSLADGTQCDDGKKCTTNDACLNNTCTGIPVSCTARRRRQAVFQPCKTSVCNEDTGLCVTTNAPAGTVCAAGNNCTTNTCDGSGNCVATTLNCTFLNGPCRQGVCNATTGQCQAVPANNSAPCDDGFLCTTGSVCNNGVCGGGTAVTCPPQNSCSGPGSCIENFGCVAGPDLCGPPQECVDPTCSSTGQCFNQPINAGRPCTPPGGLPNPNCVATCDLGGQCILSCPTPPQCTNDAQCAVSNPCQEGKCVAGNCQTTNRNSSTTCSTNSNQNCPGLCNGAGFCANNCNCTTDANCTYLSTAPFGGCQVGACFNNFCILQDVAENTNCTWNPSNSTCLGQCDANGQCQDKCACTSDANCTRTDLGQCKEGYCNTVTNQCDVRNKTDNIPCDDGNGCTGVVTGNIDRCVGGECVPGDNVVCPANDGSDLCSYNPTCNSDPNAVGGYNCTYTTYTCTDTICNNKTCDGLGGCTDGFAANNTNCTADRPGNPCTGRCNENGVCVDDVCPACTENANCTGNYGECKVGECFNGVCRGAPAANGTGCTDNLFCTGSGGEPDQCFNGVCVPGNTTVCTSSNICQHSGRCVEDNSTAAGWSCAFTTSSCPNTTCKTQTCKAGGGCTTVSLAANGTNCTGNNPTSTCPGQCISGECKDDCPCTSTANCPAGTCCCDGKCTTKLQNSCTFTCGDYGCKKFGKTCNCINGCQGTGCNSAGGNPCANPGSGGNCCCVTTIGAIWENVCENCRDTCSGSNFCTGNIGLTDSATLNAICTAVVQAP